MNVFITGATGFIGQATISELHANSKYSLTASTRGPSKILPGYVHQCQIETIDGTTNYKNWLDKTDIVLHLAANVHHENNHPDSADGKYVEVNVDGTINLAKQAAESGVRRFVYLSSIKVNGESTLPGCSFKADDPPNAQDSYALSKLLAEHGLREIAEASSMEYVIIRPPLVYGPGAKANFKKLMDIIYKGFPLPFGKIDNRRSIVSIDNLTNLIHLCLDHPKAINEIFLVSDDRDISTTELIRLLASAMGKSATQIALPKSLLNFFFILLHKKDLQKRLLGNLQVDIGKTKTLLGWRPVVTQEDALRATVKHYLLHNK